MAEVFDEFEGEEKEGMVTTKITLPRLRTLELRDLPELKTICSSRKVIVCDSLERVEIIECQKLKRLSLSMCQFLMDNYLLPLLLKRLKQIKNGGSHWTIRTLRMSFNPSSRIRRNGIN